MTSIESRPTAQPQRPRFQFSLRTLLLLFVVLGSSLGVFGAWGIVVFALAVGLAIYLHEGATLSSLAVLALVVLSLMCLIGMLLPVYNSTTAAGRAVYCRNNLKQVILALLDYHRANSSFPPAYTADKTGKPMHSWRMRILPYMELNSLYKKHNFSEPWDGPNNKKLACPVPIYACPSNGRSWTTSPFETSYVAVVGPNAAWAGEKPRNLADFGNDAAHTIMLVESTSSGIAWMEPQDLALDTLGTAEGKPSRPTVSSNHGPRSDFFFIYDRSPGANVAMADGSVHFLRTVGFSTDERRRVLEIGGCKDEYLSDTAYFSAGRRPNWPNIAALAVWLVSVGTLLRNAVRSRRTQSTQPPETQHHYHSTRS
jgi:prepilin-type processing-associated H-X9-DG protein